MAYEHIKDGGRKEVLEEWGKAKAAQAAADKAAILERVKNNERIAAQSVKIAQAQAKVIVETQIKYVDRIKTIYTRGETIEKQVPIYITADDNAGCTINTGFVRIHDAAWTGEPQGSATSADREPAGVSLAAVAETTAFNATACIAWREQALGLREFYAKMQATMK